jgi:carboxymethylenebutenolidase
MCFDFDALPPELPADLALRPLGGGAAAERLELESADGTRFSGALAVAPEDTSPAVLIFPDVRGLYPFYVELAERFAQAGHSAITFDYFGRTAGTGERDDEFEYMPHVNQTRLATVQADAAAAIAALRSRGGASSVVSVGFCFGGTHSFLAAQSADLGLAGAIGFYGNLADRETRPSPIPTAASTRVPVLGLFGGTDQSIPQEAIDEYDAALDDSGVQHELITYPGAPHSFFDRAYEEHADACEDAWRRVLAFVAEVP